MSAWIQTIPLPLIGLLLLGLMIASTLLGHRAGRPRQSERNEKGQEFLLSAVLGLLALLLGFTFSLALQRYETRRELVVTEVNALGTAWLRVQLLAEPARSEVTALMRAYVAARADWSQAGSDEAERGSLARSTALQDRLWARTANAVRADPLPVVSARLLDPLNEAFDAATSRRAAEAVRIPLRIVNLLLLYTFLSNFMLGHILAGYGPLRRVSVLMTLVLLTLALVTIIDLNRPRAGRILIPQEPMIQLRAAIAPQA